MSGTAKLKLLIDLQNNLRAGLSKAKQQVNSAVGDMQGKLNSLKASNVQLFDTIKEEIPGASRALGLLANPYGAAAAAALAFGAATVKATGMALEWKAQMAQINVTAEQTPEQLDRLSDKLLEIGSRNVAPLEEIPKAFNRIISAGLSVNDSLKTLEPTLRAAKAGFTDTETVASAAVSVMMSSGKAATRVYDILFETVKEGNAEFRDIAQYLPKVIPLARNAGFELEETAGAYASLTTKLSAEQSTTALQGIMNALSSQRIALGELDKSTGKYVSGFKSIGIDIYDKQTRKMRPLLDIIKDLNKSMEGLSDKDRMLKLDKLGLDKMATVGFSTMMQDVAGLEKTINATTNSQGALNKAYEDAKTPLDSWKIIMNSIKAAAIRFGQLFIPIVEVVGNKILGLINYVKELYRNSQFLQDVVSALGSIFSVAFNLAIIPAKTMIHIIKELWRYITGLGALIEDVFVRKLLGIESGISGIYKIIRPYLIYIKELLSEIGGLLLDLASFNISGLKERIENFKMPDLDEIKQRIIIKSDSNDPESGDFSGVPEGGTIPKNFNTPTGGEDARKISGGSQTKNITINIDSFIKQFSPTHQSINNLSIEELEKRINEMFMRVVRSAEIAQ